MNIRNIFIFIVLIKSEGWCCFSAKIWCRTISVWSLKTVNPRNVAQLIVTTFAGCCSSDNIDSFEVKWTNQSFHFSGVSLLVFRIIIKLRTVLRSFGIYKEEKCLLSMFGCFDNKWSAYINVSLIEI